MKFIDEILDAVGLYEEEEVEEVVPPARENKPVKPERKNPFEHSQKQEARKSYKEAIAVVEDDEEEESKSLFSFPFFKKKKEEAVALKTAPVVEAKEEPRKPMFPRRNLEKTIANPTPAPVPVLKTPVPSARAEEEAKKPSFLERLRNKSGEVSTENGNKSMPIMIHNREINVMVIEPASFDDCPKIADYLRNNQPVILNFGNLDPLVAKRMGDFICGSVYAINGSMKKLGRTVLICAPRNVDIDAAEKYDIGEEGWKR